MPAGDFLLSFVCVRGLPPPFPFPVSAERAPPVFIPSSLLSCSFSLRPLSLHLSVSLCAAFLPVYPIPAALCAFVRDTSLCFRSLGSLPRGPFVCPCKRELRRVTCLFVSLLALFRLVVFLLSFLYPSFLPVVWGCVEANITQGDLSIPGSPPGLVFVVHIPKIMI